MSKVIDLYEFLMEAELHQYYSEIKNDLKASLDKLLLNCSTSLTFLLMISHHMFLGDDCASSKVCH